MTMFTLGDVADILDNALDTGISIVDALSKLSDCADQGVLSREQCFQQLELLRNTESASPRHKAKTARKGVEPQSRVPSESDFTNIQSKLGGIKTIVVRSSTSRSGSSSVEAGKTKSKRLKASTGTRKRKPYKLKVEKVGYSSTTTQGSSDAWSIESEISESSTLEERSAYHSTTDYPSEGIGSVDLTTEVNHSTSCSDINETVVYDGQSMQNSQTKVNTTSNGIVDRDKSVSEQSHLNRDTVPEVSSQDDHYFERYYTLTGNSIKNGKSTSGRVQEHIGHEASLGTNIASSKKARPGTFVLGTESSPEKAQMKGLPIVDALDDLCKVADELLSVCNGHVGNYEVQREIEDDDLISTHSSYRTDDWYLDKQLAEVESQVSSVMDTFAEIESKKFVSQENYTADISERDFTESGASMDEIDLIPETQVEKHQIESDSSPMDVDVGYLVCEEEQVVPDLKEENVSEDMNVNNLNCYTNTESPWYPRVRHSARSGTIQETDTSTREVNQISNRDTFVLKSLKRPNTFVLNEGENTNLNNRSLSATSVNETQNTVSSFSEGHVFVRSNSTSISKTKRPSTFILSAGNERVSEKCSSEGKLTETVDLSKASPLVNCRSTFVLSSGSKDHLSHSQPNMTEQLQINQQRHTEDVLDKTENAGENITSSSPKSPGAFQKLGKLYSYMSRSLTRLNEINKICDESSNANKMDMEMGLSKVPEDASENLKDYSTTEVNLFQTSQVSIANESKHSFCSHRNCLSEQSTTDVLEIADVQNSAAVQEIADVQDSAVVQEIADVDSMFPAPIPEIIVPPIGTSISTIVGEDQPTENLKIKLFPLPVAEKITETLTKDIASSWVVDSKKLLDNAERREAFVRCSSSKRKTFNSMDNSIRRSRSVDSQVRNQLIASYHEPATPMQLGKASESSSQVSDRKLVRSFTGSFENLHTASIVKRDAWEVKNTNSKTTRDKTDKSASVRKKEPFSGNKYRITNCDQEKVKPVPVDEKSKVTSHVADKPRSSTSRKLSKDDKDYKHSEQSRDNLQKREHACNRKTRQHKHAKMRSVSDVSEYFSSLADKKRIIENRNVRKELTRKGKGKCLIMAQQDKEPEFINTDVDKASNIYSIRGQLLDQEHEVNQQSDNTSIPRYALDDMIMHLSRQRAEDRPWKLADSVFQFEELVKEKESYLGRYHRRQGHSKSGREANAQHEKSDHVRSRNNSEKNKKDVSKGKTSKDSSHHRTYHQEKNRIRVRPRWMKSNLSAQQWLEIIDNCELYLSRENSGEIYFEEVDSSNRPSKFDSASADDVCHKRKKHRKKWNKPKRSYSDPVPTPEHQEDIHRMFTRMGRSRTFVISPAGDREVDSSKRVCSSKRTTNKHELKRPSSWTVSTSNRGAKKCDALEPSYDSLPSDNSEPQSKPPKSINRSQQTRGEKQATSSHKHQHTESSTFVFNGFSDVTDRLLKLSTRQNKKALHKTRSSISKESIIQKFVEKMVENVMEAAIKSVPRNVHNKENINEVQGNRFYTKTSMQERAVLQSKKIREIKSCYQSKSKVTEEYQNSIKTETSEKHSAVLSDITSIISTPFKLPSVKGHHASFAKEEQHKDLSTKEGTEDEVSSKQDTHHSTHHPKGNIDWLIDTSLCQQQDNISSKASQQQKTTDFEIVSSDTILGKHKRIASSSRITREENGKDAMETEVSINGYDKKEKFVKCTGYYINELRMSDSPSKLSIEDSYISSKSMIDNKNEIEIPERDTNDTNKEQKVFSKGYSAFVPYTKTSVSKVGLTTSKTQCETVQETFEQKSLKKERPSTYVLGGKPTEEKQQSTSSWSSENSKLDEHKIQQSVQRDRKSISKRGTYVLHSSSELTKNTNTVKSGTQQKVIKDEKEIEVQLKQVDTSKTNTRQDETDGFKAENNLGSRLASLRMQLEERRKHIEKEKKKMVEKWNEERVKSAQNVFWLMIGKDKKEPETTENLQAEQRQSGGNYYKPRKSWDVYVPKDEPNEADSECSPNEDRSSKKKGLVFFPLNETKSPLAKALDFKEGPHTLNSPPMECSTPLSPQAYNKRMQTSEHQRSMHVETTTKEFMKVTNDMLERKSSPSPQIMTESAFNHFPLNAGTTAGYSGYQQATTSYSMNPLVRGASQFPLSNGSAYEMMTDAHRPTAAGAHHVMVANPHHAMVTNPHHAAATGAQQASMTYAHHATVINNQYATATNAQYASATDAQYATAADAQYATAADAQYVTATSAQYAAATNAQYASATDTQYVSATDAQYASTTDTQYATVTGAQYATATNTHNTTPSNEILVEAYQRPGVEMYEGRSPRQRGSRTFVHDASATRAWPEVALPSRHQVSPPLKTKTSPPSWSGMPPSVTHCDYNSVSEMFQQERNFYSNSQFSSENVNLPTSSYQLDTEVITTSPPPVPVDIVEDTLEIRQQPESYLVSSHFDYPAQYSEQTVYNNALEQQLSPRQHLPSTTFVKNSPPVVHPTESETPPEEVSANVGELGWQSSPRQHYGESMKVFEGSNTVTHPSESSVTANDVEARKDDNGELQSPRQQYASSVGYTENASPTFHPVDSQSPTEQVALSHNYHEQKLSAQQHHVASKTFVTTVETVEHTKEYDAPEEQIVNETDEEHSYNEGTVNDSDNHGLSSGETFFVSSEPSPPTSDQENKSKAWTMSTTVDAQQNVEETQTVVEEVHVRSEEVLIKDSETIVSEEEKATRRRSGGIALDIALSDSPSSQNDVRVADANLAGMTPEQLKKREKFIQNRLKQQQEMKAKREADMEKRRRKEEKMKERKEMLEKKEEEGKEKLRKKRQEEEELLRKKAEEEEALRKREEQLWRLRHFTSTKEDVEIRRTVERFKPISHTSSSHSGSTGQIHSPEEEVHTGHGSTTFREYSGPPVYVKPSGKSNRKIIVNAISHCCLSGEVNKEAKDKCLQVLSSSDSSHFFVLFRDGLKFRGLYSFSPEADVVTKLYGVGPRHVTTKMIEHLFKYNSGGKEFSQIHAKSFSIQVDGMTIKKEFWTSNKQGVSKTNTNLKKYPSKTSLRK